MQNYIKKDEDIVRRILQGNDSEYSILIDRYKDKGFTLAYRIIKDQFEAEDILQEAFIKTYNSLGQFKFESKFSTWFYRIVYNTALTFIRSKRQNLNDDSTIIEEMESNVSEYKNIESRDLNVFLGKIILKLPEKYSTIITLFYINELSYEEISDLTGNSLSSVKVDLFRARKLLRDIVLKNNYVKELI
ncbi:MAG: sigma-70 family RNA polymerase sigma factor [Ignavibacteria bacterium]|nr:sigma-70 family RNA polymerase sigma factor [Ignavibacteria bacterium]